MNIKQILNNLVSDESGQDLVEYALVVALIALGSVTAMGSLSTAITTAFTNVGTKLGSST